MKKKVVVPAEVMNQHNSNNKTATSSIEDEKTVLVFVSEYCVVERERFVKNCHGEVEKDQVAFCKSYPPACTSTAGVIPVLAYCQRYYKQYPKFCGGSKIANDVLQFCFAFEQFCLPELTPSITKPVSDFYVLSRKNYIFQARTIFHQYYTNTMEY
ncbi:unnamed protein product [Strongylus vulgaris]|uniref:Uncharacterized protein n=1 Tax=Strongylus vulgaris TaxID=40348 RepID=A0A3P7JEH0_STRVU|nr:unnamed protein product [Strongylus vulgaris]